MTITYLLTETFTHLLAAQEPHGAGGNMVNRPPLKVIRTSDIKTTRMWANAQRDGRPAEYRWRPLFNAAKFG